jgi:hypothetical protein
MLRQALEEYQRAVQLYAALFNPDERAFAVARMPRRILEELGDPGPDSDFRLQNEGVTFILVKSEEKPSPK